MKTPRQRVEQAKAYMQEHELGNPNAEDIWYLMLSEVRSLVVTVKVAIATGGVLLGIQLSLLMAHVLR